MPGESLSQWRSTLVERQHAALPMNARVKREFLADRKRRWYESASRVFYRRLPSTYDSARLLPDFPLSETPSLRPPQSLSLIRHSDRLFLSSNSSH